MTIKKEYLLAPTFFYSSPKITSNSLRHENF
jgi:hypothetical protein